MVYSTQNQWVLDFIYSPVFLKVKKKRSFGNWICFRPQVKGGENTYSVRPPRKSLYLQWLRSSGEGGRNTYSQGNRPIRHVETCPDYFFTARVHTTKPTVKILAANTHCKYFLKIAKHCQYCNMPDPYQSRKQYATRNTPRPRRLLQRSRHETAQRIVQTSGTSGSAYRKN
jgi:hypothetical protein